MPASTSASALVLEASALSAAQRRRLPRQGTELIARAEPGYLRAATLLRLCGGEVVPDADVPVAAICAAADIGPPGADCWLRADPVVLLPTRVELRLYADHVPDLDAAEAAQALAMLVGAQLVPGAHWHAPHPARWYLRLNAPPRIRTTPPAALLGRNVQDDLPRGPDGGAWRAHLNALQMALSAAPFNDAREQRGLAALSSLWFWGCGSAPKLPERVFDRMLGDDPVLAGLAVLTSAAHGHRSDPDAAGAPAGQRHLVLAGNATGEWLQALRGQTGAWDVLLLEDTRALRYRIAPRRWWRPWGF